MKRQLLLVLTFCSALLFNTAAFAEKTEASAKQVWQLIDYVGVDYSGAVVNGTIASDAEYAEMRDFTAQALQQAKSLPDNAGKAELVRALVTLREAVERKADSGQVSALARAANARLLAAYPMPVAPQDVPDLKRGAAVFQAQCASCHGSTGRADGPLAANLDPPPIAFVDRERAASRSVMALYQAVSQGVSGTAMPAFGMLTEDERWAVALYAGTLSHDEAMRLRGEKVWKNDPRAKATVPDLTALATHTESDLAPTLGPDAARDLMAYLRSQPAAVAVTSTSGLMLAKTRLQESLAAAHAGDKATAMRLGLSAYLDGFEPVEPTLSVRDKALVTGVEAAMLAYRSALERGNLTEAQAVAERLNTLFGQAEATLKAGAADATTAFAGALTILLREGVEALLIVVGMIAFLRKAGRTDVLRYVHAGWV
ncbi:MAG: cytochrome c, partial [Rhodocyclaceae bacterium]|nr:cytochrome c [Rhodocyclaceae bacterium]